MSTGSQKKTRSKRVASVPLPPGFWKRTRLFMFQRDVVVRVVLGLIAAAVMWAVTGAWAPHFPYRSGYLPKRDIIARTHFTINDETSDEVIYNAGDKLADHGRPLSTGDIQVLYGEHVAVHGEMTLPQMIGHSLADFGMYIAMYVLCGAYIFFHHPVLFHDLKKFNIVLSCVVATVILAMIASRDSWRAECIPLILFGMTMTIAFQRELALLLSVAVSLIITVSLGQSLSEFIILSAAVTGPVLMVGRIRSRTKLIYVGIAGGIVVTLTAIGVGTLSGQAYGIAHTTHLAAAAEAGTYSDAAVSLARLLSGATWYGLCVVLAGFLMTGLLPFVERVFKVQTDISLLELGDAAHPLLQELAHRAPGTYNHSINVASIGEAAAEAIGANGLLVRVGAYFHDIGKMLKPAYFIENQSSGGNQHDSLMPAMSTLVIIAHVKDGADLARKHKLPQPVIDFIEQHHGTTLVEFFYRRAAQQCEGNPDAGDVDESSFRYPGPKPQTREAGVMMLADAVESACRTLVDPGPKRIDNLVHEISMKRLLDGQFDECGLTLRELHTVEESLSKSLTAVYHGRVKYPDQQTA